MTATTTSQATAHPVNRKAIRTARGQATAASQAPQAGQTAQQASAPAEPASWLTASVVIAAFSSERWDSLRAAVDSVAAQDRPALETIVVIDYNPDLLRRARCELDGVTVVQNTRTRGASCARNSGVAYSRGDIVAFLDDDAEATPGWLSGLIPHFANVDVAGAGGRLYPLWATRQPRWFPGEFGWAVGASYAGMPERPARVRNVWAGNMAVRREAFEAVGGFREDFGKVGKVSRPEDTDLCLRVDSGAWIYDPSSAVGHQVPADRARLRFFLRRCFNEGRGKAGLAELNGAGVSLSAERGYARRVLPAGVLRGLRDTARGDATGLLRGAAIIAGAGAAAAGYALGVTDSRRAATTAPN
jgi:Glycosyl transferase family 2